MSTPQISSMGELVGQRALRRIHDVLRDVPDHGPIAAEHHARIALARSIALNALLVEHRDYQQLDRELDDVEEFAC